VILVFGLILFKNLRNNSSKNNTNNSAYTERITLEGELSILTADDQTENQMTITYQLTTSDGKQYELVGDNLSLNPNQKVIVSGKIEGDKIFYDQATTIKPDSQSSNLPIADQMVLENNQTETGIKKVAVFLINFRNDPSESVTDTEVKELIFGKTPNTVTLNNFQVENSIGKISELRGVVDPSGDVFGWYTVPYDNNYACTCSSDCARPCAEMCTKECSSYACWTNYADQQASNEGYIYTNYDYVIYLFNSATNGCPGTGWAYVNYNKVWLQGIWGRTDFVGLIAHEMGHSMGSYHASVYVCKDDATKTNWVPISSSCTINDSRADFFDVMGYGYRSHRQMSNVHKRNSSLKNNNDITYITQSGRYEILPSESDSNNPLIFIDRGQNNFTSSSCYRYFVPEFRQPTFFDNFSPTDPAVNGVFLRIASDRNTCNIISGSVDSLLINTHASGPIGVAQDLNYAPLLTGESFYDSYGDVTVETISMDSSKAIIDVTFGSGWNIPRTPTPAPTPTLIPTPKPVISGDLNSDGKVDSQDLIILLTNWGISPGYNISMLLEILNNWR